MARLTGSELRKLADSPEFQKIIASDSVLDSLEAEQYDFDAEARNLFSALGFSGTLSSFTLTAEKWTILWALKSPYVFGGEVHQEDLDAALYVLSSEGPAPDPALSLVPRDVWNAAAGFREKFRLSFSTGHEKVMNLIHDAFLPLSLLPPDAPAAAEAEPHWDLDWLTRICGIAARESGERFSFCVRRMPLCQICSFYVNWCRREGPDGLCIGRRATPEIARAIMDRAYSLGGDFLSHKSADGNLQTKIEKDTCVSVEAIRKGDKI